MVLTAALRAGPGNETSPERGCPRSGLNKPDEGVGVRAVLALQRRQDWGGRRAPLAGNPPASRGVRRRSEDSDRIDLGWSWVPPGPSGVSTPLGLTSMRPPARPKPREGPPYA